MRNRFVMPLIKNIVLSPVFIVMIIAFGMASITFFQQVDTSAGTFWYFTGGFFVACAVLLIFYRYLEFYFNFNHELTHAVVGLFFLKNPREFYVSKHEGGAVVLPGGNFVIRLAPYAFPLISILLLPFSCIILQKYIHYYHAAVGFFMGVHAVSVIKDFRFRQSDIIQSGRIFSILFVAMMLIISYSFTMVFVIYGIQGIKIYFLQGFQNVLWMFSLFLNGFQGN